MLSVPELEPFFTRDYGNMKVTCRQSNTPPSSLMNSPLTKDLYRALVWNARPDIQLDPCSLWSHVYPIPKHSAHTDAHPLAQLERTQMISSYSPILMPVPIPTAPQGPSTLSGVLIPGLPPWSWRNVEKKQRWINNGDSMGVAFLSGQWGVWVISVPGWSSQLSRLRSGTAASCLHADVSVVFICLFCLLHVGL